MKYSVKRVGTELSHELELPGHEGVLCLFVFIVEL